MTERVIYARISVERLRGWIRDALDDVETDALVTKTHADALADELTVLLVEKFEEVEQKSLRVGPEAIYQHVKKLLDAAEKGRP